MMNAKCRMLMWLANAAGSIIIALAVSSGTVLAQSFPNKAVRMVVPFPAGGSTDIVGRTVAQKLSEMWGQPVVVDNRPGGGTSIGTDAVAKAAPDGYTLLVTPAPFTINPSLLAKLPYDALADFAPITLINTTALVLVVNPGVPAKSVKELIALAKSKPGKLNYGSSTIGGSNHLAGELFNAMAGVKMVHIPYKGNAPALIDRRRDRHSGGADALRVDQSRADLADQGFRGGGMERARRAGQNSARDHRQDQFGRDQDRTLARTQGAFDRRGFRSGRQHTRPIRGLPAQ